MIWVNGEELPFRAEMIDALLTRRGIETRGVAVALNGEVIRRSQWSSTPVLDRGVIEIVTAAAGG